MDEAVPSQGYTREELMVIEAARRLRDGDIVLVGTGLPLLATTLAQRTHAPNVVMIIESGVIAPLVRPTPISVSDPKVMHRAMKLGTLREVLGGLLQRGLIDVGFVGGAQIDRYANINSTQIGPPGALKRRLPGSGGANDMASHCRRLLVITHHEKRRFPERCDYITSPGFLDGPGGRARAGLSPDFTVTVVTDRAVMESDPQTCALRIVALMPGVTVDDILASTGFRPDVALDLRRVAPPEPEALRLLRDELDPERVYLGAEETLSARALRRLGIHSKTRKVVPKRLRVRRLNRVLSGLLSEMKDLTDDGRDLPIRWHIMHMYSCSQLAKLLAMRRGIELELAGIAAALHDLGAVMTGKRDRHAEVAATYVRDFLNRYHTEFGTTLPPITEEETDRILMATVRHSEKDTVSKDPLVELLKDVDSLDGYLHGVKTDGARLERCRRTLRDLGAALEETEHEEVE